MLKEWAYVSILNNGQQTEGLTGRCYWSTVLGYNYNWTNIQAALALAQLRRIDDLIAHKRWLYSEYAAGLSGLKGVRLCGARANIRPTYWISTAIVDEALDVDKEELAREFAERHVDVRPLFYPLSSMPPFAKYTGTHDMPSRNPTTYALSRFGVCLPNGNNLTKEDVAYVCHAFQDILSRRGGVL